MTLIQTIPPTMRFMKIVANCQIFVFSDTLKKVSGCIADIICIAQITYKTRINSLFHYLNFVYPGPEVFLTFNRIRELRESREAVKHTLSCGEKSRNDCAVYLFFAYYLGFRRKARVIKCNRFPRQKGGHGPRRSMRRLRKLGTRNTTLLACDRKFWQALRHKRSSRIQRCRSFSERLGPRIIFFKASQVSSCSKRQFSWDDN